MADIRLRPVNYEGLSALKHSVFISESTAGHSHEFLVVQIRGDCGTEDDVLYILAAAKGAREAWWAPCTILDFRELTYSWGDEMEWVADISRDPGTRLRAPLAIIVSDRCRYGLQSLLEDDENICVDTMEQAIELCRLQEITWSQRLKEFLDRG